MELKWLLAIFIFVLLTACTPMDTYYPNYLSGTVKDGIYTTTIGANVTSCKFDIQVPQSHSDEVVFMTTQEVYGKNYTFVGFGPIASDETIYRVMVAYKGHMPLDLFRVRMWPLLIDIVARDSDRQMHKIYQDQVLVDGHRALFEVYTQTHPGYYHYISRHQDGYITLTHSFFFADYGRYGVIFWIQASTDSAINFINCKNRHLILNGCWKPQSQFLRSFVIKCPDQYFIKDNYFARLFRLQANFFQEKRGINHVLSPKNQ